MNNTSAPTPTGSTSLSALYPFSGERPDYDGLRDVLQNSVPFNNLVDLRIAEVAPTGGKVEIAFRPELTNAFGTLHAGVLFLAADMAGSAAFIGAAARRLEALTMFVLKDCRIAFLKPGLGDVTVSAVLDEHQLPAVLAETSTGRLNCDARAYLHDSSGALIGKAFLEFAVAFSAPRGHDDRAVGHG